MILHALGMLAVDLFKSRSRLEAENLFLRHQLNIALRRAPPRLRLRGSDRALLITSVKRHLINCDRQCPLWVLAVQKRNGARQR